MYYSAVAVLSFAGAVLAQTAGFCPISAPVQDFNATAGQPLTITWQDTSAGYPGDVTLYLLGGSTPSTLDVLGPIGNAKVSDGSFIYDVDETLGDEATYGIRINWDTDAKVFQYSFPFHIIAADGATDTSAGAVTHTISLSSAATPAVNSTSSTSVALAAPVVTPSSNVSTAKITSSVATLTSVTTAGSNPASKTGSSATSTTSNPTGGAGRTSAGFAVLGGLAMAVLAF